MKAKRSEPRLAIAPKSPGMRSRRIVMIAFPDAQIIDITGPLEVFGRAARLLTDERGWRVPAYTVEIAATKAGPFSTSSGIRLIADRSIAQVRGPIDTLLVAGGRGTTAALRDRALIEWLRGSVNRTRRICSVCTGAFLLAEAGLLDGLAATTHWRQCERLATQYPAVKVETDPIFVRAGKIFTSAGVTAGIDLALALARGRPRPRRCARGGARTGHVPAPSGRPVAIFCAVEPAVGGSRADPRAAAMDGRSSWRRSFG